jgi:hypothetical protein
MNESLLLIPPQSPSATSMTASQIQWIVPNQQFLMPPLTMTRSEFMGKSILAMKLSTLFAQNFNS